MSRSQPQAQFARRQQTQTDLESEVIDYMNSLRMADSKSKNRTVLENTAHGSRSLRITLPKNDALDMGFQPSSDIIIRRVGPGFVVMPINNE